jgi:hypothetical protein
MYFHPLQEEIDNMNDEQLGNRIRELTKKLTSARRFGRNPNFNWPTRKGFNFLPSSHQTKKN